VTILTPDASSYDETVDEQSFWQPVIFCAGQPDDACRIAELFGSGKVRARYDTIDGQLRDLVKARLRKDQISLEDERRGVQELLAGIAPANFGRWVYYPWSGRLVHVLPPAEFRELRLDRNRHKITAQEQDRLAACTVGVVGLSVGNAVALTLALEEACGYLKLADFDELALSNMNRVRAGVHDIGIRKTVLAARQIYEINPYAKVALYHDGITSDNLDDFLLGEPKLDIVVDECDGLHLKILLRERARALGLPVLMETSDRGMFDVERFDLEPDRPLFHGVAGDIKSEEQRTLTDEEKFRLVLSLIGADSISMRLAASLLEIDQTLATWPQLGSDVTLGGATVTTAVRRLALGQSLPSGRRYIDLSAVLAPEDESNHLRSNGLVAKAVPAGAAVVADERLPEFIRFIVEHGTLAPSGGNCQPWRFRFDGRRLWVVHDRERSRNLMDVVHRASYVALGAAIENIVIAAAHRGYRTEVESFPRAGDDSVVAALSFETGDNPLDTAAASLFPQLRQRCTNRKLPARLAPDPAALAALEAAAAVHGAQVHFLTTEPDLCEVGGILGEADRIRFLCREMHHELVSELRWTPEQARQTRDGIDLATLEMTEPQKAALQLIAHPEVAAFLRGLHGGRAFEELAQDAVASASAVGLLSVVDGSQGAILRGGRAVERLWLQSTALGLALQPLTVSIYLPEMLDTDAAAIFTEAERANLRSIQARLDRLFRQGGSASRLLLFRLSSGTTVSATSLRLPVEQVLAYGTPQTF
jgi:molybdopterin/thiamine biosynthesis adenylyltransferase